MRRIGLFYLYSPVETCVLLVKELTDDDEVVSIKVDMDGIFLDILPTLPFFIQIFGNEADSSETAALFELKRISPWVTTVVIVIIAIAIIIGFCGVIVARFLQTGLEQVPIIHFDHQETLYDQKRETDDIGVWLSRHDKNHHRKY